MSKLGDLSIDLIVNDDDFTISVKNADRLLRQITNQFERTAKSSNRISTGFAGAAAKLRDFSVTAAAIKFTLADLDNLFMTLPKKILATTGEFERLTKLMEGLSRGTDVAQRMNEAESSLEAVVNLSKNAPFQVSALADTFVKLKVGGVDPLAGSLTTLSDSVARFGGDSELLRRAAVAIQQMGGKGVISMEELRQQLGEAVPDAMKSMAQGMGVTLGELTDTISKGIVETGPALAQMFAVMRFNNAGAAEEMMKTWTGVNSRLQTEWELLQRTIGEAGFADAVKEPLKELTQFMSSAEMHRWASDLGSVLGEVATTLADMVRWLKENWNWISKVAGAAAGFYAVNKALAAGKKVIETVVEANKSHVAALLKQRAEQQTNAQLARYNAMQLVEDKQFEIQKIREKVAAITAETRALQLQHDAMARRAVTKGLDAATTTGRSSASHKGWNTRARAEQAAVAQQIAANAALIRANEDLMRSEAKKLRSLETTSLAMDKSAAAARRAAQGITAIDRAVGAARVGFNAIGGWLGVISLALTAGATLWNLWADRGEKAIKRVDDAIKSRAATAEDVEIASRKRDEVRAERDHVAEQLRLIREDPSKWAGQSRGGAVFSKEEIAKAASDLAEQLDELNKELDERTKIVEKGNRVVRDSLYNSSLNEATADLSSKLREVAQPFKEQKDALEESLNQQIEEARAAGDKEKLAELQKRLAEEPRQLMIEAAKAQVELAKGLRDAAREAMAELRKAGPVSAEALAGPQAQYDAASDAVESARRDIEAMKGGIATLTDKKGGGRAKEDPLLTEIERARTAIATAQIRMDDLRSGVITLDRIRESVIARIRGEIASGKYGKGKDRPALEDANVQLLIEQRSLQQRAEILARVRDTIDDMGRDLQDEGTQSIRALFDPNAKVFAGSAVEEAWRQLEKLGQQVSFAGEKASEFSESFAKIVPKAAAKDIADMGAELRDLARELNLGLLSPTERIDAVYEETVRKAKLRFETLKGYALANAESEQQYRSVVAAAETELHEYLTALAADRQRQQESDLAAMVRQWNDSTEQMKSATAEWASDGIDALTHFVTTGELKWREFLASMLTDMARMSLQKTFGNMLQQAFDGADGAGGIGGFFAKMLNYMGIGSAGEAAGDAAGALAVGAEGAAEAIKGLAGQSEVATLATKILGTSVQMSSLTTEQSMLLLSAAAQSAAAALASIGGQQSGGIFGSLLQGLAGGLTGGLAGLGTAGGAGMGDMMANAADFIPKTVFPFDKGGIMTELGPVPLRKYAKGGIAKSPQLALFGEGSHNEAYVPLPDGRRIPVALEGAAGTTNVSQDQINISIVVNEAEGTSSTESSGAQDRSQAMKGLAKEIEGIVRATIVKEKRANGLLSR